MLYAPNVINYSIEKLWNDNDNKKYISEKLIIQLTSVGLAHILSNQSTHTDLLTSISQLPAYYSGIGVTPQVITHCPPLVIDAHLHSTLILIGASHQTNISISTVASRIDYSVTECSETHIITDTHVNIHQP